MFRAFSTPFVSNPLAMHFAAAPVSVLPLRSIVVRILFVCRNTATAFASSTPKSLSLMSKLTIVDFSLRRPD